MTGEDTRRLGDRDEKDSEKRHNIRRVSRPALVELQVFQYRLVGAPPCTLESAIL